MAKNEIQKLQKKLDSLQKKLDKGNDKKAKKLERVKKKAERKAKRKFTLQDNFIDVALMSIFIATFAIVGFSLLITYLTGIEPSSVLDNWFQFVVAEVIAASGIKIADKFVKLKSGQYSKSEDNRLVEDVEVKIGTIDYDLELKDEN